MDRLCYHKVTVRPSLPSMSTTKSTTTSSTSARDQSAGEGLGPGVEDVIQSGDHPGHHQSKTRPHHHHRHPHPPVTPDDAESIGIITNEVDTTRLPPPSSRAAATCWPALSALQLLLLSAVLIQQHHAGRASFLQIMTGEFFLSTSFEKIHSFGMMTENPCKSYYPGVRILLVIEFYIKMITVIVRLSSCLRDVESKGESTNPIGLLERRWRNG